MIRLRGPLTDVGSVWKLDRRLHWHYYSLGHGFHFHGSVYTWISLASIPSIILLWLMLNQSGLRCSGTLRILRQKPPQMLFVASSQDMGSLRKLLVTFEYQDFFQQNDSPRMLVSPYRPSSNGLPERFVQTFKYALESSASDPWCSMQQRICNFMLSYRSTCYATTGSSRAFYAMADGNK